MNDATRKKIESDVKGNRVMVYMKGTAEQPMCGFSGRVVEIFKSYQVPFKTFNILEDEEIRNSIKEYSDWPTIPQIFIDGEFIGGCDIITEMHNNGDLAKLLKK